MTSEKKEEFLLHNFEAKAGTPVWRGQPQPEPTPAVPVKQFLLHNFEAKAETPVWGNKPVEDEEALRKRLYRPVKPEVAAAKKRRVVCGQKKPESIVLPKVDEEEDKAGVAPQTATKEQKKIKEKQD